MTAYKQTLIYCDGGDECPRETPYGDEWTSTAYTQRNVYGYKLDGWRYVGGKDYCPACVARLGIGDKARRPAASTGGPVRGR